MKAYLIIMIFTIELTTGYSQEIDYNKIILPESVKSASFEERVIQIAWNNHPSNKVYLQDVEMAKHEKSVATFGWLDNFYAAANINEFTINPDADVLNRSAFWPRYNIGLRISLGDLFLTPMEVRVKKDQVINSELKVNERKLSLRREVLTSLEKLRENYRLLKLRQRMEEDYLIMYNDAEKKFSSGLIDIEKYREAIRAYSERSEEVIQTKSQFNQSKIELESFLGLRLEEVDGYQAYLNQTESN